MFSVLNEIIQNWQKYGWQNSNLVLENIWELCAHDLTYIQSVYVDYFIKNWSHTYLFIPCFISFIYLLFDVSSLWQNVSWESLLLSIVSHSSHMHPVVTHVDPVDHEKTHVSPVNPLQGVYEIITALLGTMDYNQLLAVNHWLTSCS